MPIMAAGKSSSLFANSVSWPVCPGGLRCLTRTERLMGERGAHLGDRLPPSPAPRRPWPCCFLTGTHLFLSVSTLPSRQELTPLPLSRVFLPPQCDAPIEVKRPPELVLFASGSSRGILEASTNAKQTEPPIEGVTWTSCQRQAECLVQWRSRTRRWARGW